MNPVATLKKHGLIGTAKLYCLEVTYRWACVRTRNIKHYKNPDDEELAAIEDKLTNIGVGLTPLKLNAADYDEFCKYLPFPENYHGGKNTGHWHEKVLEHYISYKLLNVDTYDSGDVFLDVAAGGSPWVQMLRERAGVKSFAIDLAVRSPLNNLDYYLNGDATKSPFENSSIRGISLHCAYEMFAGDSDVRLIPELCRILEPGGAVVIVPLYLHTHYCCYSSPEYWGKGFADSGAVEYIRPGTKNIQTSRKYDPLMLKKRILEPAQQLGMEAQLFCLRGQADISPEIYCHFVLVLRKT